VTEKELAAQLQREGFSHTYVWEDEPNTTYPDHKHLLETANIVLTGEVTITVDGKSRGTGQATAVIFEQTQRIRR
jgi:hypothetical protein